MSLNRFKFSFRNILFALVALFLLMFATRIIFSYRGNATHRSTDFSEYSGVQNYFSSQDGLRKNYASEKQSFEPSSPTINQAEASQKYEKTATLNARTDNFESDEQNLRQTSNAYKAIIQYEQRTGNPGHRQLHLLIGVKPELFDSFYVATQKIGSIFINEVTKVDKTTEFRELNAKKASLQKALSSLTDLKNRAGSISDLVGLHDKILDIERQMQELGVELGNFSSENEFCTFRFSLVENAATRTISFVRRVVDAFVWTVQYYLLTLIGLAFLLVVAWLVLIVGNKLIEFNAKK
jgi:hypothetical protein